MSLFSPQIFALDLSDLTLKIIKLKKGRTAIRLASFLNQDIPSGIIQGGEIRDSSALASILRESTKNVHGEPLNTSFVAASLPEERTFLRVIQIPAISEEELPEVIAQEAENYIPLSLEDTALSFETLGWADGKQDHLDILLVAFPKNFIATYTTVFKEAGLMPVVLEPESLAIARALVPKGISQPILLIDFGATQTSFIVFSGNAVRFTSSIALSSTDLTKGIMNALHISFEEAEALKIQEGMKEEHKILYDAMHEFLESLLGEIKKQLNFYRTHAPHEHVAGERIVSRIILCGGGSLLKGFDRYLARTLLVDVDLGDPWSTIRDTHIENIQLLPFHESISYTTAIGLALGAEDFFNL